MNTIPGATVKRAPENAWTKNLKRSHGPARLQGIEPGLGALRCKPTADAIPNRRRRVRSIFRIAHATVRLSVYLTTSPLRLAIEDLFK